MSMQIFPQPQVSGGIDWSKYTPKGYAASVATGTAYASAYSITGEGYLSCAIAHPETATNLSSIRIKVDGSYLIECSLATTFALGMCQISEVSSDGNYSYVHGRGGSALRVPAITHNLPDLSAAGRMIALQHPIFFKQSIDIELKNAGAGAINLVVSAGVKS